MKILYTIAILIWYKRLDWFSRYLVPRLYMTDLQLSYVIWQEELITGGG